MAKSQRILNCIPSKEPEKDWKIDNSIEAGILRSGASIPEKKDLREQSWWKINDQESTGSCVGWATADSLLRWHYVKEKGFKNDVLLSVRYVWMASKETDQFFNRPTTFIEEAGTSLKSALDVCRKFGTVTEKELSFGNGSLFAGDEKDFYATASRMRISSYFNLGRNLTDWRRWLSEHGPILTRLDVDDTWYNATDNHGNLDMYKPETIRGGHAVALVGYTKDRFIVRNSWGTGWGDKGYGYASNEYASAAFTEAYGIEL